ncbi:hypothetical protein ACHAPT_005317 [Fusarium lateritium]
MPILTRMANIRENGDFVDFAFLCRGERINVHRVIICKKSPVFYREAKSRTYKIDDYPFAAVQGMVEYLYTGDYSEPEEKSTAEDDAEAPPIHDADALPVLSLHTAMVSMADKYDINGLASLAVERYTRHLEKDRNFERFLDSVPGIYNMPAVLSQRLRDAAVAFARAEVRGVMADWTGWAAFQEVLDEFPEFSKALLCSIIERPLALQGKCRNFYCKELNKNVPVEVLQCRCKKCGKGGASVDEDEGRRAK